MRHIGIDEDFHSRLGARTESEELYIERSGFVAFLREGKKAEILDVGLGLGYNALATITHWMNESQVSDLNIISLEKEAGLVELLCSRSGPWMEDWTREEKALFEAVPLDLAVQRRQIDAKDVRAAATVTTTRFQRAFDMTTFEIRQRER